MSVTNARLKTYAVRDQLVRVQEVPHSPTKLKVLADLLKLVAEALIELDRVRFETNNPEIRMERDNLLNYVRDAGRWALETANLCLQTRQVGPRPAAPQCISTRLPEVVPATFEGVVAQESDGWDRYREEYGE